METLLKQLTTQKQLTAKKLENTVRQFLRIHKHIKKIPRKKDLLKVYHDLLRKNKIKRNKQLEILLVKRAVRTLSGVTIVTVLTKPFPCPGKCIYCPDEKGMPKSYISDEPAAARALKLHFDPYEQVVQRIKTLQDNGHPTDKIELIVKGGSWNAYQLDYQYWFILQCFEACNNTKTLKHCNTKTNLKNLKSLLKKVQTKNEKAKHRIIGLTLETRPDLINKKTIEIMRELGCTRIELGVQTTDDKILKLIKRGHNVESVKKATTLLKNYGFKVDYHLMPQLPESTPIKDLKMMLEIFENPAYRPDMIKIYPCTVIKNTELYKWMKSGKYKPYSDRKLIDILKKLKSQLPYYVRISRLIRDIPSHHIHAGNKMTNLRQVIQKEMAEEGLQCRCLRCREIGHLDTETLKHLNTETLKPTLFIDEYEASGGMEYFLSYEDKNRNVVYAFCRLRICMSLRGAERSGATWQSRGTKISSNPRDCDASLAMTGAFIRELHTYGQLINIGQKEKKATQHKGLGKKLIKQAEKICKQNNVKKLAVISGVGVRGYYRKMGYRKEGTYMVKSRIT